MDWANFTDLASGANPGGDFQKAAGISNAHNRSCSGIRIRRQRRAILKVVEMEFRLHFNRRVAHAPLVFPCLVAPDRLPEYDGPATESSAGAARSAVLQHSATGTPGSGSLLAARRFLQHGPEDRGQ